MSKTMKGQSTQKEFDTKLRELETKIDSLAQIVTETKDWQIARQGEISGAQEERSKYMQVVKFATLAITFLAAGYSIMKTAIKDYFSKG